ncbi:MAG: 2-oxoacid:acceptor oxidoreductase subunit alpha [Planctomycetota bacterium]
MTSTKTKKAIDRKVESLDQVVIRFAGDSGDGMQLTGSQFTNTTALFGNDLATFPDYPAEIRAPAGTIAGVSAFQLRFSNYDIHTPGDMCDVLVTMNPAAFKVHVPELNRGGILLVNTGNFLAKDLRLAGLEQNPLDDEKLDEDYRVIRVDLNQLTKEQLKESGLDNRTIMRCKNFAALGMLFWMFNRSLEPTIGSIDAKFREKKPELADANIAVLKAGYHYAETVELLQCTYEIAPAPLPVGTYRNISGNQAIAIGLVAASKLSGLDLFYGSYPITPASDILHALSTYKSEGVLTFQAEDEIAALCSVIGAAYAGKFAVTASSGPGIALKSEAMGLAVMAELPLVIINVQRGGPSTGLPTKTEQADLGQAFWGRSGECPIVVLAAATPSDCFRMVIEACRIATKYMVPVMLLSDGYLANGSEPWLLPEVDELPEIDVRFRENPDGFLPYMRDPETLARPWVAAGTPHLRHRIGGLEKEDGVGNISYDPDNHARMVGIREEKIARIARDIPEPEFHGEPRGDLLVVGWGSTLGPISGALEDLKSEGLRVSCLHLRHLHPFPPSLAESFAGFKKILVPEMNLGQLRRTLAAAVPDADYIGLNKVNGRPFTNQEISDKIRELAR